jgi:hypothetical protein
MTIPTSTARNDYVGSGITGPYPVTWKFFENADLLVTVDGVVKTLTTDYTVTGAGEQAGGALSFTSAISNGAKISIEPRGAFDQETDIRNEGGNLRVAIEDRFDRLCRDDQVVKGLVDRSLKVRTNEASTFDCTLPEPTANYTLAVNAGNTGFKLVAPTSVTAIGVGTDLSDGDVLATGSTSSRTLGDRAADWVNVKDYGAIGNGVANDTAAINAALAVGHDVYIPPGVYLTDGQHTAFTQRVFGHGRNTTTLKRRTAGSYLLRISSAGELAGSVCDLGLDGNNLAGHGLLVQNAEYAVRPSGRASNLRIINCAAASGTSSITGIAAASEATITTSAAHGISPGDVVEISGVVGFDTVEGAQLLNIVRGSGGPAGPTTYNNVQLNLVSGPSPSVYTTASITVTAGAVSAISITTNGTYSERRPVLLAPDPAAIGGTTGVVVKIIPAGSPNRSIFNTTIQADTTPSTTTFKTILPNATGYSAYVSGGTIKKVYYGLCISESLPNYGVRHKAFDNISFLNNYGNIYTQNANYCTFSKLDMRDACNGGYGVFVGYASTECTFDHVYMESGVCILPGYGNRHITFSDLSAYITSGSSWTRPWLYSHGFNASNNIGGENAGLTLRDIRLRRDKTGQEAIPLIHTNAYQCTIQRMNVIENGSASAWGVIRDDTTYDLNVSDVTVETSVAWDLFHSYSIGGVATHVEKITYTQGIKGTVTLPGVRPGVSYSFSSVRDSLTNVAIRENSTSAFTPSVYGYIIENIYGDVNLTNVAVGNTVLKNIFGTVTDPGTTSATKKVGFAESINGKRIIINPEWEHADNTAALAAGRAVGDVYRTATGQLMTVF